MLRAFGLILLFAFSSQAQLIELHWQAPMRQNAAAMLWFDGATGGTQNVSVPSFCGQLFAENQANPQLSVIQTAPLTTAEIEILDNQNFQRTFQIDYNTDKSGLLTYCLLPVRRNRQTGELEKLIAFEISVPEASTSANIAPSYKTSKRVDVSILNAGDWYKVGVTQAGVYKITPQFLADCGFSISNLPSADVRIFGNGKGILSEVNADNTNPELRELPLQMFDGGDGVFNGNDYALFYANGPHQINYNEGNATFDHTYNIYSDVSYYFITTTNGSGKRMNLAGYNQTSGNYQSTSFDDYAFLEDEKYNLVGSGREWFGDLFDFTKTYNYTIQFQNVRPDTAYLVTRAAARSAVAGTSMNFSVNGNSISSLTFAAVSTGSGSPYVRDSQGRNYFIPQTTNGSFSIQASYNNTLNSAGTAWLDFIGIQVRRDLSLTGNSLVFRDSKAYQAGGAALYSIGNATLSNTFVWDVTDFHNIRLISVTQAPNNKIGFAAPSDTLRTFVALKGTTFPTPSKIGSIANQNLHGLSNVEMVIVAYPAFKAEADRLATYHMNEQGLSVVVVTPEEIYNEFSSGMQDITAIKLFLRHLYKDSSATKDLRYLLLFGDASYDYKDRTASMHNFVPIYQSQASYSLYSSFCTDDFFGFLDDNEGRNMLLENLDIGIGRMPVKTVAEAKVAVDKILHYDDSKTTFGDWRLRSLLLADDVDDSWEQDFLLYTDRIEKEMDTIYPVMNFEKIYADSYVQIVKAGSQRYPDARADMFRKVERGVLVASYLGHGGEVGWAKERLLQLADVTGWDNLDNMPVFTTVTCEFTRVDDPGRVSAGEQLFLNPNGGAIALFSTLRPVFATPSTYNINRQLFRFMFDEQNGEYLSLGEVILATKNSNNSGDRLRFSLIGDPATYLALPENKVITDEINGKPAAQATSDTLKALSKVIIKGHIEDANGNNLNGFNGLVFPTVFDKKAPKTTLVNDGAGQPLNYETRENIIYRGKSTVRNGEFEFEFVVPLDISFVIDNGKISYYATDSLVDAGGFNKDVLVGGLNLTAEPDDEGPIVRLFINDTNFISGGLTDKDPTALALIADSSGINTVGTGIGHDILGILDGNTSAPYVLNDYFQSDVDSYQSGTVNYPFFDLAAGVHELLVRAWDVNNNMGQDEITFVVDESAQLALKQVLNYPNPFHSETRFQFEHNRAGEQLDVDIQIFNQQGALIKRIEERLNSLGNRVNQITWDGRDDNGSEIGSGVYVYRVIVRSAEDGSTATDFSKLVFIR